MSLFIFASLLALGAIFLYALYEGVALFTRLGWPTISEMTRVAVAKNKPLALILAAAFQAFVIWFYGHVFLNLPPN